MPVLVATDHRALFACYRPGVSESVVIGEFACCSSVRMGLPNDEVLHGHPCGSDLRGYRVYAIAGSRWLADVIHIESVHGQSEKHSVRHSRHYFLVFHDCSIEALATDIIVHGTFTSMGLAVAEMIKLANPM